jgi:hypothetical protein
VSTRSVLALSIGGILAVFAVLLLHRDQRRSGSDLTPNGAFIARLSAGQEACQGQELLPAGTAAMRITIGTYGKPGPPVRITATNARGELLASGGLRTWRQGVVTIPVTHVSKAAEGLRVCLRNDGPQRVTLAGTFPDPGYRLDVAGNTIEGRLRYDYMRLGRESWLELLPTLAYRSTLGKSDLIRHWAWIGALVLMLLAVALAAVTLLREESA